MILETSHLRITRLPRTEILKRYKLSCSVGVRYKTSIDIHYFLFVINHLLICAGIETNLGPNNSNFKGIIFGHNNVCSLYPKLDIIAAEIIENDIIAISETRSSRKLHR